MFGARKRTFRSECDRITVLEAVEATEAVPVTSPENGAESTSLRATS